jgi:N-acetylglucosamine malate deacetylase 1
LQNLNNILIVAPHPDDEVLGCGGAIKKLTNKNCRLTVLIMTRGKQGLYSDEKIENVRKEALAAHRLLGISKSEFLDFPAPELDTVSISCLASTIERVIRDNNIDTVFLPHRGDIHHDHRAVFNAGLVASRPVNKNPVRFVFAYETLSETEWAPPFGDDQFIPTTYIDISAEITAKLDAMKCFKSQLREFPNPRSLETIESLAKYRGSTIGCTHAEAFITVRQVFD